MIHVITDSTVYCKSKVLNLYMGDYFIIVTYMLNLRLLSRYEHTGTKKKHEDFEKGNTILSSNFAFYCIITYAESM